MSKSEIYQNAALMLDGYKTDHRRQYPSKTTFVHSNLTARSSKYATVSKDIHENKVVLFGLSYYIQEYLIKQWVYSGEYDINDGRHSYD